MECHGALLGITIFRNNLLGKCFLDKLTELQVHIGKEGSLRQTAERARVVQGLLPRPPQPTAGLTSPPGGIDGCDFWGPTSKAPLWGRTPTTSLSFSTCPGHVCVLAPSLTQSRSSVREWRVICKLRLGDPAYGGSCAREAPCPLPPTLQAEPEP